MVTSVNTYLYSNNGLSLKIKSFSAQWKLSSKWLTYLLHVKSIWLRPVSSGLNNLLSPNEKFDSTFWISLKTQSKFQTES